LSCVDAFNGTGDSHENESFSDEEEDGDGEEDFESGIEEDFEIPEASTSGTSHDGPFIDIEKTIWCLSSSSAYTSSSGDRTPCCNVHKWKKFLATLCIG
jgi:hypothetical protein